MDTLEKITAKLPEVIVRNLILSDVLGGISSGIDDYLDLSDEIKLNLKVNTAEGSALDSLAADVGLNRAYHESNISLRIRVQNAVETAQRRGSQIGVEREGGENLLVTPFLQRIQFAIGIDPIAAGSGLSSRYSWTQVWNDGAMDQSTATTFIKSLFPVTNKIGIDYVAGQLKVGDMYDYEDGTSMVPLVDNDGNIIIDNDGNIVVSPSNRALIQADGFHIDDGALVPHNPIASVIWGDRDLGAGYSNFTWLIDWISFRRWDIDMIEKVSCQFSSDQLNWTQWKEYNKNDLTIDADVKRYIKFKLELTLVDYESLEHYSFARFILKALDAIQLKYGGHPIALDLQPEFLK